MTRILPLIALFVASNALGLSPDAREFMRIVAELEPVHCEKRKLRREIALAQVQGQDAKSLQDRFAALDRDPKTAGLQERLTQLAPRVSRSGDPDDLAAISKQQKEAFYRCE